MKFQKKFNEILIFDLFNEIFNIFYKYNFILFFIDRHYI